MKIRLLFLLIVFFAGVATGIYISTPVERAEGQETPGNFLASVIRSDEFAKKVSTHLHKGLEWGKNAVETTSQAAKKRISDHRLGSDG